MLAQLSLRLVQLCSISFDFLIFDLKITNDQITGQNEELEAKNQNLESDKSDLEDRVEDLFREVSDLILKGTQ